MSGEKRIVERLDALLQQADQIAHTKKPDSWGGGWDAVDRKSFTEWFISSKHLVGKVAGRDSEYYQELESLGTSAWADNLEKARPILSAVRKDYAEGWLRDFKELAAAEVFDDFLEMAQHLCANGYHVPAASLAGAVLEDSLRRLHLKKLGQWEGDSRINKLNDALHKAAVYTQSEWRQIQVWGDIRNEADHGHFDNVDPQNVAQMIAGIRDFVVKHVT